MNPVLDLEMQARAMLQKLGKQSNQDNQDNQSNQDNANNANNAKERLWRWALRGIVIQ
jgi:hypothetical protein